MKKFGSSIFFICFYIDCGCDIDLNTNPFEAGMERLLDLDSERDFIGKQALLKIRETGTSRRLVGVELSGEPLEQGSFTEFWPLMKDQKIGDITVALHSPRLQKNIGYAMVEVEYATTGTSLMVESPIGKLEARVVEMPFVQSIKA